MKKQLLCLVGAIAFTAAFAQYNPPVRELVIPYASSAVTIDGYADEAFYSAEQNTVAFNVTGSTGADADFTFTFKVAFDKDYLYLCSTVLDDYNNSWDYGLTNQWTWDNIEVFCDLDTNGSGTVTAYDTNTIQIRFNRGIDSVNDAGRSPRSTYLYAWENTADGWVFETGIPWKFVLGAAQLPEDICQYFTMPNGMDFSGADSDTDGPDFRDCQTAWDQDGEAGDAVEDNAWNNRSVFGVVTFEACPTCVIGVDVNSVSSSVAYPNPTTGMITFDNVQGTIEIMNLAGQVVLTSDINQVDMSQLSNGIYMARIGQQVVKVVKE